MTRYILLSNPIFPILLFVFIFVFIDYLTFSGVKQLIINKSNKVRKLVTIVFWSIPIMLFIGLLVLYFQRDRLQEPNYFNNSFIVIGFFAVFYVPKMLYLCFLAIELIIKRIALIFDKNGDSKKAVLKLFNRLIFKHYISKIGIISAFILMGFYINGIISNRFNYQINRNILSFSNLPAKFDGFKIVQFSDLHIGSLIGNEKELQRAVKLINNENPDLIVFTGDMVNFTTAETAYFTGILKQLHAKYGKYSILGNHDYGDYKKWKNIDEKVANNLNLLAFERQEGFKLLLNESDSICIDNEKIALIGTEYWSRPPIPRKSDFYKASKAVNHIPFKILLTHDPRHWDDQIKNQTDVVLTLAGHTHGAQMALNFMGLRWSPAKLGYTYWMGLYRNVNQILYVNVGLGYVGYPGRVGALPEIAVFELKTK